MTNAKDTALRRITDSGIVAILRTPSGQRLLEVAEALLAGGVEVIEVTFSVPQAHRVLEQIADRLGERILLGAGSVLDTETARTALLSGAEFIVAPTTNPDVIKLCNRYGKIVMPGALTPTEVLRAWEAGADIVKLFPSDTIEPAYLKALLGPFPHIRLMPTGGITPETAADFLRAGACTLGVGGSLAPKQAIMNNDFKKIESLARQFVYAVKKARETF